MQTIEPEDPVFGAVDVSHWQLEESKYHLDHAFVSSVTVFSEYQPGHYSFAVLLWEFKLYMIYQILEIDRQ